MIRHERKGGQTKSANPLAVDLEGLMRIVPAFLMVRVIFVLALCVVVVGCRSTQKGEKGQSAEVTPVQVFTGKIALVKANLKYVVVDGELGALPQAESILNVYRGEKKVGEIKVSPQVRSNNYAADIVSGSPKVGDTVRSN